MPRSRPPAQARPPHRTDELIQRIEAIIEEGLADPLSQDPPRPLSLPLFTRKRSSTGARAAANITFPGRTEAEARKFSTLLQPCYSGGHQDGPWRDLTGMCRSDTAPPEERSHGIEDGQGADEEVRTMRSSPWTALFAG